MKPQYTTRGKVKKSWIVGDVVFNKETGLYWEVKKNRCYCISPKYKGLECGLHNSHCRSCYLAFVLNRYQRPDKYLKYILDGLILDGRGKDGKVE